MNETTQSWWFVFYKDQLLLEKKENGAFALPYGEIPPITIKEKTTVHTITTLEGKTCKSFSLSSPFEESAQEKRMRFCTGTGTVVSVLPAALLWNRKRTS